MQNRIKESAESIQLKKEIQEAKGSVYERTFGPSFFGRRLPLSKVSFVKAKAENMAYLPGLLNGLDKQHSGRMTSAIVNYFVDGPFILSQTGPAATAQHSAYVHHFKHPHAFMQYMIDEEKKFLAENANGVVTLKEFVREPTTAALVHGMFNVSLEEAPELANTLKAFSSITSDLQSDFYHDVISKLQTTTVAWMSSKLPSPLSLNSTFRHARDQYVVAAEKFLVSQTNAVFDDIQNLNSHQSKSILTHAILELIKTKPELLNEEKKLDQEKFNAFLERMTKEDVKHYLIDRYIRTIPGSVAAGENIVIINTCALVALAENHELLDELRAELEASHVSFDDPAALQNFIVHNKNENGLLHRIYIESLRRESMLKTPEQLRFESNIWRYTDKNIIFGNEVIHPSYIAIVNAVVRYDTSIWSEPEKFDPNRYKVSEENSEEERQQKVKIIDGIFSYGNRLCPGKNISEYLTKMQLAYVAMNYDWKLEYTEKDTAAIENTNIHFEKRLQQRAEYTPSF